MFTHDHRNNDKSRSDMRSSLSSNDYINKAKEIARSLGYGLSLRPTYYPANRMDCDRYCEIVYEDGKFAEPTYCIRLDSIWYEANLIAIKEIQNPAALKEKILKLLGLSDLEEKARNDQDPARYISYDLYLATSSMGKEIFEPR